MDIVKPPDTGGGGVGGTTLETQPTVATTEPATADEGTTPAETPPKDEGKKVLKLPASIKPPVKTGRFQTRISDLVGQRDRAQEEARQLREQLSKMQGIPAGPKSTTEPAQPTARPDAGAALNPEDFQTYGEYVQALVERTMEQKEKARGTEKAEQAYQQYRQEKLNLFNEKAIPLAEAYGDGFWDAITDPSLPISDAMADAILELDDLAPYTMLWLAAHRDDAMRIARMNPRSATVAIGRLASNLDRELKAGETTAPGEQPPGAVEGQEAPAAPSVPAKPSPVPVPRGSSVTAAAALPSDKDSVEEWLRKETDRIRRMNPNARFYGAR